MFVITDIEVFPNLFTMTNFDVQTKELSVFEISERRNDYVDIVKFIKNKNLTLIGYNIDKYDYPVLHHMVNHYDEYYNGSSKYLTFKIKNKSDEILNNEFTKVATRNKHCGVIDLFTIFHFNNKAKLTSLKDLEIALNMPLVEDLDMNFNLPVPIDRIDDVISYNKNDVKATFLFFLLAIGKTNHSLYKNKNVLTLRSRVCSQFGIDGMSMDDIALGTELILKMYAKESGIEEYVIRRMRTNRKIIYIKDCIPEWAEFKNPLLKSVVERFKKGIVYDGISKGVMQFSQIYHGIRIDYGAGGAHACIEPGIYDTDENEMIIDLDVDLN